MKLLIASVDALPQIGGISLMGHHLANAFSALGHGAVFLAPKGSFVPAGYERNYLLCEDWESQVRKREGADGIAQDERIQHLGERLIERYGIERVLLLHPFYYALGLLDASRAKTIPASLYFHGMELRSQLRGQYPISQKRLIAERKIGTLRERIFYSVGTADEILVNSSYTATLVEPFSVRPEIRATGCGIPQGELDRELGISPTYNAAQRVARRTQLGLSSLPTMAFVGRLVPSKRADRLVQLCRRSDDLAAVIMGDGPDREKLEELVVRYGLQERVRIMGSVSESEKWKTLQAADAFCLPSEPNEKGGHVEGFGIALLEGAAAGALPVSSGTGGMVDVVEDGKTGIVLSPDDKQAADRLSQVLGDETKMQELVDGARKQLSERYTWERVAERMMDGWS